MTFFDITMRMLIANFRRYRLYFLCNVFSIALFYSFAAIFTNPLFMNGKTIGSDISGNIYAPSFITGIFLVLFIPYSFSAFLRNRKQEYGIFLALGMSEIQVLQNMLLENMVVAVISLICGLTLGTILSFFFYFIIQQVIGLSTLRWHFNAASYLVTALLYGVTLILTLITGIIRFIKTKLIDLIKEKYRPEERKKLYPGIFLIGLIFVIISVIIIFCLNENGTKEMLLLSFLLMIIGLSMILANIEIMEQYFTKLIPCWMDCHTLELSIVRHHRKSRNRIAIITACMIGFCLFFSGLCVVTYPCFIRNALQYSPYDLVYTQIFGMNQVKDNQIESILTNNGVTIKSLNQLDYLRDKAFTLLRVSEVNYTFHCNYQVSEGEFLCVFQHVPNDGYQYDFVSPKRITYEINKKELELKYLRSDTKILFNDNPTFADMTLVLNDNDYNLILSQNKDVTPGILKLYTLNNWRQSEKGIKSIQKYLLKKNQIDPVEQYRYFRATSKYEEYKTAQQSSEFLIFLVSFIVIQICIASNIIIHFKIISEAEEEKRMFDGLYRIGVTNTEMLQMIRRKNYYYYLPQVIAGIFIGVIYNYIVVESTGFGWTSVGYCLLFGILFFIVQIIIVSIYSRTELINLKIQ